MSFHEFNSFDDMMEFMRQKEQEANDRVTPEQAQIGYNAWWMRLYDDVLIFGYVPPPDAIRNDERALGASEEELDDQEAMLVDAHQRGYRYGQCFSEIEPDGEWGSTHISEMVQITKAQFLMAKALDWSGERLLEDDLARPWVEAKLREWSGENG